MVAGAIASKSMRGSMTAADAGSKRSPQKRGSTAFFKAAEPNSSTGTVTRRGASRCMAIERSPYASSSATTAPVIAEWALPKPPNSSGMTLWTRPSSHPFWTRSDGTWPFSSASRACGRTLVAGKAHHRVANQLLLLVELEVDHAECSFRPLRRPGFARGFFCGEQRHQLSDDALHGDARGRRDRGLDSAAARRR